MCLQSVMMESKRTLVVPERSLCVFWHGGCPNDTLRKLQINFWEGLHLLCVSKVSSWSLRWQWWFLRGVFVVFDMVDAPRVHQGSYISIFRSLPSGAVLHLLYFSRASSWSLRGRWWILRGVLVVFDMVDAQRIHQGSYISIFRSLPSGEVLHLLCVSRASSWSLRGRWWILRGVLGVFDMVDAPRIHQGSYR